MYHLLETQTFPMQYSLKKQLERKKIHKLINLQEIQEIMGNFSGQTTWWFLLTKNFKEEKNRDGGRVQRLKVI